MGHWKGWDMQSGSTVCGWQPIYRLQVSNKGIWNVQGSHKQPFKPKKTMENLKTYIIKLWHQPPFSSCSLAPRIPISQLRQGQTPYHCIQRLTSKWEVPADRLMHLLGSRNLVWSRVSSLPTSCRHVTSNEASQIVDVTIKTTWHKEKAKALTELSRCGRVSGRATL